MGYYWNPTMAIRVVVIEDRGMFRELLVAMLGREPDIVLIGAAASGSEAIALARSLQPDVLLLDVGLPDRDSIEVARELASTAPAVRVVALSMQEEPEVVAEMLNAGAVGYVLKSAAFKELIVAIRQVMLAKIYCSATLAAPERPTASAAPKLGRRELQVLALIAQGRRTPDIARELGIAPGTVEVHRRNIMNKLGLHTIAELTRFAIRRRLIRP